RADSRGDRGSLARRLVAAAARRSGAADPAGVARAPDAADRLPRHRRVSRAVPTACSGASRGGRSRRGRNSRTGRRCGGRDAPASSEDSVVRTAARLVGFLADARLPEPVTQATLTAAGATIVLTPFESPDAGAMLLTAVVSRASLAWLERLCRIAAREVQLGAGNGKHNGPRSEAGAGLELRAANVPAAVRDLAGSLTAFGPVSPTLLRDHAGALSACLFLPSSLDALPLARFARDLHLALEGAEVGPVTSVILKLGAHRLVLRAMDGASGSVTMLVGVGRIDRPGLARIELDRAATRLDALVRS